MENYTETRTVPIVQKNDKTAIGSDIRAHSVETEKYLKTESDIQKVMTSQKKSFVNT